jgi:hypothetical protein
VLIDKFMTPVRLPVPILDFLFFCPFIGSFDFFAHSFHGHLQINQIPKISLLYARYSIFSIPFPFSDQGGVHRFLVPLTFSFFNVALCSIAGTRYKSDLSSLTSNRVAYISACQVSPNKLSVISKR